MSGNYLFVYGSLRRNFSSPAREVLDTHADYVGEATFRGKLYEIDWYPGVVPSDDEEDIVFGEVYRITDQNHVLPALDRYEGCSASDPKPHAFIRKKVRVSLENNEITAWIYFYNLTVEGLNQIPSGDYLNFKK